MTTSSSDKILRIDVGGRRSPLSQAQIREVELALNRFYPEIHFQKKLLDTQGDKDLITSLRSLDKTNFFTREVDNLLLSGSCRIAIHSAKDLPDPIPDELALIALTKGLDPRDSLVLRKGESLETLPKGAIIATSSEKREGVVRKLRSDLTFIDIRGTIEGRLSHLNCGKADGVVIAEAALIRLNMTDLNRMILPGKTTRYQGQLAILAKASDHEMQNLFSCLDCRLQGFHLEEK